MNNQDLAILSLHRRELHKTPEIDKDLFRTNEYVTSTLKDFDCTLTTVVQTGVCAYFDRGKDTTTAYRSDMDALLIQEINTFEYISTFPGKMHACGHDGHMAMLLAFAKYVDSQKDLPYNVLLIFQPAEETSGGAKEICDTGIFEKYNVTKLYGLHLWPDMKKGQLSSCPGPMMAQSNEISFNIKGKSTHATTSEKGIDALLIGCRYVLDLYDMQKNEISNCDRTVLKIGRLESGTVRNAISGMTTCLGTMRAFRPEIIAFMMKRMREIAAGYEKKFGCRFEFTEKPGYPPVYNDAHLYNDLLPSLSALDYVELTEAALASEDFSFYGKYVPSVFFFLGTGHDISLHSNNFDFDEETMLSGLNLYKILLGI